MMQDEIVLTTDYPSRIAQKLLDDEIDIGLVPVAIIPRMKGAHITTDFCIVQGTAGCFCLPVQ
jgi:chorismate dehydratase